MGLLGIWSNQRIDFVRYGLHFPKPSWLHLQHIAKPDYTADVPWFQHCSRSRQSVWFGLSLSLELYNDCHGLWRCFRNSLVKSRRVKKWMDWKHGCMQKVRYSISECNLLLLLSLWHLQQVHRHQFKFQKRSQKELLRLISSLWLLRLHIPKCEWQKHAIHMLPLFSGFEITPSDP